MHTFPDFDDILRNAVQGVSVEFSRANRELHSAVARAATAIVRQSDGQASLALRRVTDDPRGRWYLLEFITAMGRRGLGNFRVDLHGFPIDHWDTVYYRSRTPWMRLNAKMHDPVSIDRYIANLLVRPDLRVAEELFALRRQRGA